MRIPGRFAASAVLSTLVACASGPLAQSPFGPRSAGVPMVSLPPSVTTASAAPKGGAPARRDANGYRRVVRDGQELYCRKSLVTGGRLSAADVCITQQEMSLQRDDNRESMHTLQDRLGGAPPKP